MQKKRVLLIAGTRPEAIKLAPLYLELVSDAQWEVQLGAISQHRELLSTALEAFQITPDYDLDIMTPGQSLYEITARALVGLEDILRKTQPKMVVVQGDTTSALCGALAAFYAKVPVGHVEAGLRTGDMSSPWPEEANRRLISLLSHLHFAPTASAKANLLREGIPAHSIELTGNTGVDAVLAACRKLDENAKLRKEIAERVPKVSAQRKTIVVTAHRRENFGPRLENICMALKKLLNDVPHLECVFSVHPNPCVRETVQKILRTLTPSTQSRLHLIEPLDYLSFVYLLRKCYLIVTDSGGIVEEAPSLGKFAVVVREKSERPEGLSSGFAVLADCSVDDIYEKVLASLTKQPQVPAGNPYGDGHASKRISTAMKRWLGTECSNLAPHAA